MATELRRVGRQLVLYTNDRQVYRHLNGCALTKNKVPYIQAGKLVGIDFYFDRRLGRTIRKVTRGQMLLGI